MKFACSHCGTRYAIADEKVRGKALKVRCKKCQNVIAIWGPDRVAADQPTGGAATGPVAEPHWYLACRGERTGPFPQSRVVEMVRAGQVAPGSFAWCAGMATWQPVDEVSALQPPPASGSPSKAVPAENTRFFMAAAGLDARRRTHRIWAVGGSLTLVALLALFAADASGILRIPGVHDRLFAPLARKVVQVVHHVKPEPAEVGTSHLSPEERRRLREQMLGIAPRRRATGGGQQARGTRRNQPESSPASSSLIPDLGGMVALPAEASPVAMRRKGGRAESVSLETRRQAAQLFRERTKPETKIELEVPELPVLDSRDEGLTAEQIAAVVTPNTESIHLCYNQGLTRGAVPSGKMVVQFTVAPTGTVTAVDILTRTFRNTRFGDCVVDRIRRWKFPTFQGEAMVVEYPFILTRSL